MAVATAAVVGTAISAYGAYDANKKAKKAAKKQDKALEAQNELAHEQLDFSKGQYNDWKEMFQPIMNDLSTMAYEEQRPDYAAISADVGSAFDASQDMNRRQMERYGVSPTDGATQASETEYGLGRALAKVGGNQAARSAAKDSTFNRLGSVYAMGNGQYQGAMAAMGTGYGAVSGALGNQASLYGSRADAYSQAAAEGAQGVGYGLGQLAGGWGKTTPAATPTSSVPWQTQPAPWNTQSVPNSPMYGVGQ